MLLVLFKEWYWKFICYLEILYFNVKDLWKSNLEMIFKELIKNFVKIIMDNMFVKEYIVVNGSLLDFLNV